MTEDRLARLVDEALETALAGDELDVSALARRHGVDPGTAADACRAVAAVRGVAEADPDEWHAVAGGESVDLPEDYELRGELGRGGMGVVYRVRQRSLDREVALKLLRPADGLGPEALQRFRREARVLAKLRHRHVVGVHEVGLADGRLYFTMDLVDGSSLRKRLKQGALGPAEAVRIVRQVASAVAYVHSHGLVHRDLKPANVLLDGDDEVAVTDFGLALDASADEELTRTGQLLGTPSYMAPEQARGDAVDERTDVYALGVLLHECLAGTRPFTGDGPLQVLHAVLHDEPAALPGSVPRDLRTIVGKAMAREPGDRYATANALLLDLERFEAGEAIHARPPTGWETTLRWARRHTAALVVGVGLSAAFGVYLAVAAARTRPLDPEVLQETVAELTAAGRYEAAEALVEDARNTGVDTDTLDRELALLRSRRARIAGDLPTALTAAQEAWDLVLDHLPDDPDDPTDEQDRAIREVAAELTIVLERMGRSQAARARLDEAKHALEFKRWGAAFSAFADDWLERALDSPEDMEAVSALIEESLSWCEDALERHVRDDVRWVEPVVEWIVDGGSGPWLVSRRVPVPGVSLERTLAELERLARNHEPVEDRWKFALALAVHADLPIVAGQHGYSSARARLETYPIPDPTEVLASWEQVRDLDPEEAFRVRVRLGIDELKRRGPGSMRRHLVRHWLTERTDVDGGAMQRDDARAIQDWWERHGAESPVRWLSRRVGLDEPATRDDRDVLLQRLADPRQRSPNSVEHLLRLLFPDVDPEIEPGRNPVHAWRRAFEGPPPVVPQRVVVARFDETPDGWPEEPAFYEEADLAPDGETVVGWDRWDSEYLPVAVELRAPVSDVERRAPAYSTQFRWKLIAEHGRLLEQATSWDRRTPSGSIGSKSGGLEPSVADPVWVDAPLVGRRPTYDDQEPPAGSLTLLALVREEEPAPGRLDEWRRVTVELLEAHADGSARAYDRTRHVHAWGALAVANTLPLPEAVPALRALSAGDDASLAELAMTARLMAGDETAIDEIDEPVDARRPHRRAASDERGVFWRRVAVSSPSPEVREFAAERAARYPIAPEPARAPIAHVGAAFVFAGLGLVVAMVGGVLAARRRPTAVTWLLLAGLMLAPLDLQLGATHFHTSTLGGGLLALAAGIAWWSDRRTVAVVGVATGIVAAAGFAFEWGELGRAGVLAAVALAPFLLRSAPAIPRTMRTASGRVAVPAPRRPPRRGRVPESLWTAALVFLLLGFSLGPVRRPLESPWPLVGFVVTVAVVELSARSIAHRRPRSEGVLALTLALPLLVCAAALAAFPDTVTEIGSLDAVGVVFVAWALVEARVRGLRAQAASVGVGLAEGGG